MLDLFREELREYLHAIAQAIPSLPTDPTAGEPVLEALKQIRGAARLLKCEPVATLAAAVSGFLRAAREGKCELSLPALEWIRYAVAVLAGSLATDDETFPAWAESAHRGAREHRGDVFTRGDGRTQGRPPPPHGGKTYPNPPPAPFAKDLSGARAVLAPRDSLPRSRKRHRSPPAPPSPPAHRPHPRHNPWCESQRRA